MANLLDLTGQDLDVAVRKGADASIRLEVEGVESLAGYTAHVSAGERGGVRTIFVTEIDELSVVFTITHDQTLALPSSTRWIAFLVDDATSKRTALVQGRLAVLEFGPDA